MIEELKTRRQELDALGRLDHRSPWALDVDRILHSRAYTRYIDKTQVFFLLKNDHITHRVLHVQVVSRLARTIGRELDLELDLIEAIALGHDLGHPPFGHDGEGYLSELCLAHGLGPFHHAVMGIRFLERLEKNGLGLNLTLGTLDGILCHDGEVDFTTLRPLKDEVSFPQFEIRLKTREKTPKKSLIPWSAEGCLVRLCDSISYVGRDFEDAIEVGLLQREELPLCVTEVLGDTNGKIVYSLVEDLRQNSQANPGLIAFSPKVAQGLKALKSFNRERIYFNEKIKTEAPKIKQLYALLFEKLLLDFQSGQPKIQQVRQFLDSLDKDYPQSHQAAEMTRDFLAGMTDEYFLTLANDIFIPKWHQQRF